MELDKVGMSYLGFCNVWEHDHTTLNVIEWILMFVFQLYMLIMTNYSDQDKFMFVQ